MGAVVFATAGYLTPAKRVEVVLGALARIRDRLDFRYRLVGRIAPGHDLRRAVERLPEPAFCAYLGVRLPLVSVDPFRASAAAVLRVAARAAGQTDGAWPVHAEP